MGRTWNTLSTPPQWGKIQGIPSDFLDGKIHWKELSGILEIQGTTSSVQGGASITAFNISPISRVKMCIVSVYFDVALFHSNGYQSNPGYQYDWSLGLSPLPSLYIFNHPSNSFAILNKAFSAYLFYD